MKYLKQLLVLLIILSMLVSCELIPGTTTSTTVGTTTGETVPIIPGEEDDGPQSDPYVNVDKDEFYANYSPATTYMDAYYRSQHYLMSGSIDEQDQAPTLAESRPTESGKYIRNTSAIFSEDGNTYYVIDSEGNIVNRIFRCGAYVTLDEVAAYVLAFADIPANYTSAKLQGKHSSPWGKYARGNHSNFIGSTSKYPYEPELPNISGCGGSFAYYEIDIGTTGTDCDPGYPASMYNTGSYITRGAARIVYTHNDLNGNGYIEINERYVFYTYNHYNDFREYLNYEGGWGEMFGNMTGGGELSSKTNYNPTDYPEVIKKNLWIGADDASVAESDAYIIEAAFVYLDKKYFAKSFSA